MLHRRQFILAAEPHRIHPGWPAVDCGGGRVLSHCPTLPVRRATDADGQVWHLLGLAVQSLPDQPDPVEVIAGSRSGELEAAYRSWSGRWLLIGERELHMDAGGTLGVFFTRRDGRVTASSSPALVTLAGSAPAVAAMGSRPLMHEAGLDWYPPPQSGLAGVRRLLPSQILMLPDGSVRPRPLYVPPGHDLGYEGTLARMESLLVTAVGNFERATGPLMLQLTAGYDTRLLLATVLRAGIEVETFTFRYPHMAASDQQIPPKLAEIAGFRHRLIPFGADDRRRKELFAQHTAGHTVGLDVEFFARGSWDALPEGTSVLNGGVFEVARGFYWGRLPPGLDPADPGTADRIFATFRGALHNGPSHRAALAEWLAWVARVPVEGFDLRDRFYLEQRVAGWLSTLNQGIDLTGRQLVQPANCAAFLALALSLPPELRRISQHQADLVRRMAPELLRLPINPPESRLVGQVRRLPGRLAKLRAVVEHRLQRQPC